MTTAEHRRLKRRFFGTDGIRGEAFVGLLAKDQVSAYGQALGVWLARKRHDARVLIGRDTRRSGPLLQSLLAAGIVGSGHHVVDGGVLPTPAVQSLCREMGFDLAIVISASHNPAQDNGIKFFGSDGRKLPDEAEELIEAHILSTLQQTLEPVAGRAGHSLVDLSLAERYVSGLVARFQNLRLEGQRIVLDCANGAASWVAPEALKRLGADVLVRGASPDGDNINAGCGVFHVAELGPVVREERAVLGAALDGDADRMLLVDEHGHERDGDHILGLLASHLDQNGALPNSTLVTTVMANLGLKVYLEEHGIRCEMTPVGDRHVAEGMAVSGAALGGEQSGHIIFREGHAWYGDGLYTLLRILEVMAERKLGLAELCQGIEKYPQRLINVVVGKKPPLDGLPALVAAKARAEERMGGTGRVLLRYSGTESLLRVMVEGKDLALVEELAEDLASVAREALP
jgi:phosphoglucosamine mutase